MGFWRRLFGGGNNEMALARPDLSDLIVAIDGDDGTRATKSQFGNVMTSAPTVSGTLFRIHKSRKLVPRVLMCR